MTMTKKEIEQTAVPNEEPVKIDGVNLNDLLQPVDFNGAISAGTPTYIGINRPRRDEWISVRPGEEWIRAIWVIEEQQDLDREIYIVTPELAKAELEADARYAILHLAISSTGRLFWWCIKMGKGSRRNHWAESALKAVDKAKEGWVRVMAAREGYEVWTAKASMPEPHWPEMSPEELTVLAFGERIIATVDHPVARRLTLGG
jgi:hypothetical protein